MPLPCFPDIFAYQSHSPAESFGDEKRKKEFSGVPPFGVNLTVFASYGGCREAASLPAGASGNAVWGTVCRGPEQLFFLFLRAAAGGAQEMRKLGHSPKPQVKGGRP